MAEERRAHVFFRGYVQGVGFRFTASMIARSYPITGFVRNVPDGSVEVVAEGEPAEVEAFIDRIADRMRNHISGVEKDWQDATDEFESFEVEY